MAAVHKLVLDDFLEDNFILLAIHSPLEPYRLAYELNKILHIQLKYHKQLDAYDLYEYEDEKSQILWNLINNKTINSLEEKQKPSTLFQQETNTIKYLVPEYKKTDYFIKISDSVIAVDNIISKIKAIPQIITTFAIATDTLKSKNNLIFY
ncbi:IPExxxVDY family protein [Pseudofulvibacter geojedonensis]|uniref:IPExxxVDY family protein n=1 Tax=Pseudofulvibacter geojedonensis TaxID=1123758 RepID=A0ABW3I676_9FLAO